MLQTALDQFRSIYSTMPVPSRIIAGLLLTAIIVAMGFLVRGSSTPSSEYLLGGRSFSERDLDAAEVAFGNADLRGWTREGRRIKIPIESRSEFLKALESSASLPLSLRTSVQAAIEKASPFESNEQRVARERNAKLLDIARSIMMFHEVRTARVEYDLGERMGLSRARPQSASVTVEPEGIAPLSRDRVMQIKELVRAAFAGMSTDDVVVTDTNGSSSFDLADDDDPLSRKRREEEERFEMKIRNHLMGYGKIHVATHVEIDPTMSTETASLSYEDQPTTLNETSRKRETESSRPMPGGVPGAQTNALSSNRPVKLDATAQTSKTKEDERTSNRVAGQEYSTTRMAGLPVKRVKVSIGLPRSYYKKVWTKQQLETNPDQTVDDIKQMETTDLVTLKEQTETEIQQAVTALLPDVAAGEDRFPLVQVWDYIDLPEPALDSPATTAIALSWLSDSWQTLAMLGLAAAALLIARSSVKSLSGNADPTDFKEGFGLELPAPPVAVEEQSEKVEAMEITGGSLQDELVALVEDNPEVAANVIRSWVGEAA
ncbi:flagellar M-ring protein FliF C-terminal domain-containing protein [Rhodopirellula bahusiensis]|uniref:Beta-cystathionase n=1 Tax=Rhodopirellula bahusiensis TaxID=2014065 RepID=A0A2G1WAJ4_9BACT|nr:flagellar M-ring protein FliF C-terminal domain-containing protein [Rhodopirellula bahusiensis]PHQ36062.1 beta-cystathionase [Rhodopirellula bahusiensis]